MNALDFGVLAVLAICAIIGYRRGLVLTVYRLVSFAIALFLAIRLHPFITRALRGSFVYEGIRERIARSDSFETVFRSYAYTPAQFGNEAVRDGSFINALPLPQPMRDMLYNNNTPDIRELLRVGTLEDFVAGFFANIVLNVISMLIVFVLVLVILKLIGRVLNIVDKIPVIASFNRAGGLAAGVLIGVGIAWLGLTVVTMFFSTGGSDNLYGLLQGSVIVRFVLDNGWLLPRITAV